MLHTLHTKTHHHVTRPLLLFLFVIYASGTPGTVNAQWTDVPHTAVTTVNTGFNGASSISNGVTAGSTVVNTSLNMGQYIKTFIGDPLAVAIARGIIRQLTAQTVNWINSGFRGNPAFVTNPDQFFLNTADNVAARFLSTNSALNQLCGPFKASVRLALAKSYLNQTMENYACSLGTLEQNFDNFTRDFSQGGWDGWFAMTQNNLNNPYGAFLTAQQNLDTQISAQFGKKQKELDWGRGFLSWNKCVRQVNTGPQSAPVSGGPGATVGTLRQRCAENAELDINNPDSSGQCLRYVTEVQDTDGNWREVTDPNSSFQTGNPGECPEGYSPDETGQCANASGESPTADLTDDGTGPGDCAQTETVTPGSLIEAQLAKITGTGIAQLELTNSINQVVSALFTQLVGRVVGGIGNGLRGAARAQTSTGQSRSYLEQLNNDSPEVQQENAQIQQNIEGGLLPQFAESTDGSVSSDLFWVPPDDSAVRAKAQADADAERAAKCASNPAGCSGKIEVDKPIPVEIVPGSAPINPNPPQP